MGTDWATLLSAIAASIAAILTLLNLWFTGRREGLAWKRAALETAFVDFLTAAYANRQAAKEIAALDENRWSFRTRDEWVRQADRSHEMMLGCATRLRILASDDMAESALDIHSLLDDELEQLFRTPGNTTDFRATRTENLRSFRTKRDAYVRKARQVLRITR
jgi:hypothetical protein